MDVNDDHLALLANLRLSFWTSIGITALLGYDIISTLDEEVRYFWTLPFGLINLSFFLLRYAALIRSTASIYRNITTWGASILDWVIILCMDYILLSRVRALYSFESRDKKVISCIRMLYFVNAVVMIGSLVLALTKAGVTLRVVPGGMSFCDVNSNPIGFWCLLWSAPLTYDSVLMALALNKAANIQESLGVRGTKLVKLLVVDQALYFIFVLLSSVVNIVSNSRPSQERSAFLSALYTVGGAQLLSLQGSRMLIRLKEVGEGRLETDATFKITSNVSSAHFRTYTVDEDRGTVVF